MPSPPYRTPLDAIAPPRWTEVEPGALWLTTEPLYDLASDVYAILTYGGAGRAAALFGGTVATPDDVQRLHDDAARGVAIEVPPVTLPTVEMVRGAGFDGAVGSEAFQRAAQALRVAEMGGLPWARLHIEGVRAHLAALGWDGASRVANAGKHWVAGAPAGRAWLMGAWDGHRFIQPRPALGSHGPHGMEDEADYMTTTLLRRTTPPPVIAC